MKAARWASAALTLVLSACTSVDGPQPSAAVGGPVVRASWYGGGEYLAARTSTGEPFNPRAHTAAHRTLPFGTRIEVANLANGRRTVVRINDRGPAAWTGRALDLSRAAAIDLDMIGAGEARVSYRILN